MIKDDNLSIPIEGESKILVELVYKPMTETEYSQLQKRRKETGQ